MDYLKWSPQMSLEEKSRAVETALFLGFHATAAKFPIVSEEEGIKVPERLGELAGLYKTEDTELPSDYVSATKSAHKAPTVEFRKGLGLETIFSKGILLKDTNEDMLPDQLDVKFIISKDAKDFLWKAACNLAYRFGMETTAYEGKILAEENYKGNVIIFKEAEKCTLYEEQPGDMSRIIIEGSEEEMESFITLLCEKFPLLPEKKTWRSILMDMTDSFVMKNLDGELAAVKALSDEEELEAYVSPEYRKYEENLGKAFSKCRFQNYKSGKVVYEKEYDFPWEKEVFESILEEKVYPKLKAGDKVRVFGALSEEKNVRDELVTSVSEKIANAGASVEQSEVICAYKQGFSWIDEIVLPALLEKSAKKVKIYFKPFLPEGQTDWLDENGATPSYHNLKADNPDKWYDLPIRYLQELYPIEDMIREKLGIDSSQIEFCAYEGEEDITYLCTGEDAEGHQIYENTYKAYCSERPFLNEYSQMGKVHPATGYIQIFVNDEEVVKETVKTDLEYIWDTYQTEVLPDCKKYVEEKFGDNISIDMQPFFNELRLEVTASEPDYRLDSREDLISSLDALHEDMYFVAADYFKNYGVTKADVILDAPGLILPVIHQKVGKPHFKVTLSEQLRQSASIEKSGKVLKTPEKRENANVSISKIDFADGKFLVSLKAEADENIVKAYAELLDAGILEASQCFTNVKEIAFVTDSNCYKANVKEAELPEKDLKITDIDLSEHELIGYERCIEILSQLKRVPGIEVFRTTYSYTGRELYAIELLPKEEGYVSYTKRITKYPSEFINTRHHANEVSGTNGMFMLIKKLLCDDKYKDLPDKLNLIMVPMENVDGAAIHYELQKEHPYWKFHVARFSAIGKEFYYEHFKEDTIHREAMGLTKLYDMYVPDMMVDNHGVPSHEWEQQFSGYTSPSYKGFWLPRSLLYGYFWTVTDDEYKSNYPVNKQMEDVIADEIAKDAEMTRWNKEWTEQFERYAHGWMPKLFPADYYKDMINYWIPFKYDPNHRYPSIRYPWLTTVAYTSEIADETAQGEYLHLCAKAHVAHDEATIQMLTDARCVYEQKCELSETQISISNIRQRPIIVK